MVHAQNSEGIKRQFTDKAWSLLPTKPDGSKNGFRAISEQPISNKNKGPEKPNTGGGKSGPVVEQKVKNIATNKGPESNQGEGAKADTSKKPVTDEETKAAFLNAADGINAGVIKDYFDKNKIKYGKKDAPEVLYEQLGTALNFDVVELQKLFS